METAGQVRPWQRKASVSGSPPYSQSHIWASLLWQHAGGNMCWGCFSRARAEARPRSGFPTFLPHQHLGRQTNGRHSYTLRHTHTHAARVSPTPTPPPTHSPESTASGTEIPRRGSWDLEDSVQSLKSDLGEKQTAES